MPTFQIRLSVQERERLRELADDAKLSMSALVRKRVGLESRETPLAPEKRTELVREALADLPEPAEMPKFVAAPDHLLEPSTPLLTCPMPDCLYHAQSSKARCPVHNRQVR